MVTIKKEKSVEELLLEFHNIDQKTNKKPRVLKTDGEGNLLLDPKNPEDVAWFNNDEEYDVI